MFLLYKLYLFICFLFGVFFLDPSGAFATQLDQIVANDAVVIERLGHIENVLSVQVGTTCIISLILVWSVFHRR
ncbi:MAG: hypothetical protein Q3M24_16460 [Candidatus Electrothrix aestuarii]|uniref:Uncharacterized protein n=1 Tax=Candidatus Electrothrix aestuarii TaxID=3062594 RepID=A0AAU8LRK0_9BACT|nr:hypothetical protein [Candidatus Electrothrix aestuarii]